MGVLEKVSQMKRRGLSDEEIIGKLRDEKISPREIKDAMNQSQIKNAVSVAETSEMEPSMMEAPVPETRGNQMPKMQEPVQQSSQGYAKGSYTPKTKEMPEEEYPAPSPQEEYYAPQPQQYPQQQPAQQYQQEYQPQEYEYSQPYQETTSTDTIMEIAEQVFSENMKTIQKKIDEFSEFKTISQAKIDNAIERIKKIEMIIDKLQIAILEKIGSYGKTLDDIKKEMSMMQDSFGKIVNPLVDQSEENFSRQKKPKKSVEDLFQEKPEPKRKNF